MNNNHKTVYVLIGPQGSGKTYWAANFMQSNPKSDIVRISQDDQGREGHRRLFSKSVSEGKSIIVDRMNFNYDQRKRYTQGMYQKGYKLSFVLFDISKYTCLSRLAHRENHPTISKDGDHNSMLDFYFKEFESPSPDEYDSMTTIKEKGVATTLDLRNICCGKRIIVVGDIHGCYDQFIGLLDKCHYKSDDMVVATGDLVDRGPKIKDTLLWFKNTTNAYSVMGNHDNKLMRYWKGNPVKVSNGLGCTIEQCKEFSPSEWHYWIQSLPHMIRLPDIHKLTDRTPLYVVHAGVDGRKDIDNQKIETCLYTRYVDGDDAFDSENGTPWWKTMNNKYAIASGHIVSENARPTKYAYCLDAGAYQGIKMRALVIDGPGCYIEEIDCKDVLLNAI